ncbi:neuromedin-U receptor 2 [Patella vulgata]|uniref:neuromedin-U receptor 2 n=1 Tax=Patella vulgata TaxID=6465 RepID=UPI0024A7D5C9|nr:neuromedin-U receptor 2 [Patella vulgata]
MDAQNFIYMTLQPSSMTLPPSNMTSPSNNMTLPPSNMTSQTSSETLESLNRAASINLLPVIIYMVVVMVIGISGNLVVCFIYKSQLRERNSNSFLVYLAALDLISCCVNIPFELSDLLLPYTFDAPAACKIFRFVETWLQSLCGLTLVSIAYSRYRIIYKPFKDIKRKVLPCSIITVIVAILTAVPALVIFGKRTVPTSVPSITGTECSTDDSMLDHPARMVYYACLLFTFVFSLVCFLTFYILIGVRLMNRQNHAIGETLPQISSVNQPTQQHVSEPNSLESYQSTNIVVKLTSSIQKLFISRPSNASAGQMKLKTGRMTTIFLAVTISFVLSYVPYLVVKILKTNQFYFNSSESMTELLIYNFCVRSTFLSNAINPVIYGLLSKKFRHDCAVKIFRRKRSLPR